MAPGIVPEEIPNNKKKKVENGKIMDRIYGKVCSWASKLMSPPPALVVFFPFCFDALKYIRPSLETVP